MLSMQENQPLKHGVRVRPYTPADLDGCLAIFETNVPRYFISKERDAFRAFLEELPGPYIVLEDEQSRIVACGGHAMSDEPGRADLCWGMVRQEKHRKGFGRTLIHARIDAAKADPAVRVIALNTSQLTTGFYERFGFRVTSTEPDGYGPGLDRCEMRLVLRGR
jgi:ribosomal protein S18 acetylase RimI-like enzyme